MPTEITETEVVTGDLQRIAIGSQKLRIPRSPTLRFMFRHAAFIKKLADQQIDDSDIEEYYSEVLTFLRRYNPRLDDGKVLDECQLSELIGFYGVWFGGAGSEDEDGDGRPPRRSRSGGATRPGSRKSASR